MSLLLIWLNPQIQYSITCSEETDLALLRAVGPGSGYYVSPLVYDQLGFNL